MDVLIVDDDPKILAFLENKIRNLNCKTMTAQTGYQAKTLFETDPADMVFLDLFLPDMPGQSLIPVFREISPDVAVVAMTGYNSETLERETRKLGLTYYLVKPFEFENITLLIEHMKTRKQY